MAPPTESSGEDSSSEEETTTDEEDSPPAKALAANADEDDEDEEEEEEEEEEDEADSPGADAEGETVSSELVLLALEALEGDDVAPIVRLAFERQKPLAVADGASARQDCFAAPSRSRPALRRVAASKVGEAHELVAQYYGEFVSSMNELQHVQEGAEDLSTAVRAHNQRLQAAGAPLLHLLSELEGARAQAARLADASSQLEAVLACLHRCRTAGAAVEAADYYSALRLLERVRGSLASPALAGAPPLLGWLEEHLPRAEALVEGRAMLLLQRWLRDAARLAPSVGRRAVAAAAAQRCAEERRWEAQLAAALACSAPARPGALAHPFTLRCSEADADEAAEAEAGDPLCGAPCCAQPPLAAPAHARQAWTCAAWPPCASSSARSERKPPSLPPTASCAARSWPRSWRRRAPASRAAPRR